jgi:predicted secreted Zn-dependent protease
MNIPSGLFARQRLDEQARMVRDHVAERALVREAERHTETTSMPSTQASIRLVSIESAPNCQVRSASAERPA